MAAQIRYFTSADGTRIACYLEGGVSARDLLTIGGWMVPRALAAHPSNRAAPNVPGHRHVGLERRGIGSSQREVHDLSLGAQVADVLAVIDGLGCADADIIGTGDGGAVAAAFAARYPERVGRLVWNQALVRGADVWSRAQADSFVALIRENWGLARRTLASMSPVRNPEFLRWYVGAMRKEISPEVASRYVEFWTSVDLTDVLPLIKAPTLIIDPTRLVGFGTRAAQDAASLIADCRLIVTDLEPADARFWAPVLAFLGGEEPTATKRAAAPVAGGRDGALHTVLFTDLEASTAQTQALGDEAAHEIVRRHNAIVRGALGAHGGREVKHTGDGIMATFPTASGAAECALAIQREAAGAGMRGIRIGMNAGEPIAEGDDLFGTTVQLARRVCDAAPPGGIYCTNVVRELCAGKGIAFADEGEAALKGFAEAVRLYSLPVE